MINKHNKIKFFQIAANNYFVYGMDSEGQMWERKVHPNSTDPHGPWQKSEMPKLDSEDQKS